MAAPLPARYWGKVVAAVQGVVLTVAVSGLLPRTVGMLAVGVALVLLVESFGRGVGWLYRTGAGPRTRRTLRLVGALAAGAVVWAALVAPSRLDQFTPAAFARIPLEGLALVAIGLVLPPRPRRIVAAAAGLALGLLAVVKLLDAGFTAQLGRPFNLVLDWSSFGPAIGVVRDSVGSTTTVVVLVLAGIALTLLVVVITASTIRLSSGTARHRRGSARGVAALGVVWAVCAALSLQLVPAGPVASASTAGLAVAHGREVGATVRDRRGSRRPPGPSTRPPASPRPRCSTACAARTSSSSSSRATGSTPSRTPPSPPVSRRSCATAPPGWPGPGSRRAAPSSTPPSSAATAGSRTRPCSRGCGSTASRGTTS